MPDLRPTEVGLHKSWVNAIASETPESPIIPELAPDGRASMPHVGTKAIKTLKMQSHSNLNFQVCCTIVSTPEGHLYQTVMVHNLDVFI